MITPAEAIKNKHLYIALSSIFFLYLLLTGFEESQVALTPKQADDCHHLEYLGVFYFLLNNPLINNFSLTNNPRCHKNIAI